MLGIIGKSGSGKSTLANLMLKLHQPSYGNIVFKDNSLSCGYVPQDIYLLDNTLKANIALAEETKNINEKKILKIVF